MYIKQLFALLIHYRRPIDDFCATTSIEYKQKRYFGPLVYNFNDYQLIRANMPQGRSKFSNKYSLPNGG